MTISKKIRVMLVDDHTLFRSGLKMLLEAQKDIEIAIQCENATEALKALQNLKIDLILMDVGLPDVDGLEATRRVKEKYPSIKVIMLTMHNDEPYLLKALEAGAVGYVLKEAATTELVSAIREVMKGDMSIQSSMIQVLVNEALKEKTDKKNSENSDEQLLTDREKEVLQYIVLGYTNQEIANKLYISVKTVDKHKAHMMEKLNLKRRYQVVKYAIENGLINFDKE